MDVVLKHRVVDVDLNVRQVDNRAGKTLRPRVACVAQAIILTKQAVLLFISNTIAVKNSMRASDVGAQRFRDLRGDDTELLENENLWFSKKHPTVKFLTRQ
ncbi:MAG: hypothetical protein EBT15_04660 [Betaproteobacteria bacterium]|nr:hypothetical protein [Betaproteobacteria bacterium]